MSSSVDSNRLSVIPLRHRLGLILVKQEHNSARATGKRINVVFNVQLLRVGKCNGPSVYVYLLWLAVNLLELLLGDFHGAFWVAADGFVGWGAGLENSDTNMHSFLADKVLTYKLERVINIRHSLQNTANFFSDRNIDTVFPADILTLRTAKNTRVRGSVFPVRVTKLELDILTFFIHQAHVYVFDIFNHPIVSAAYKVVLSGYRNNSVMGRKRPERKGEFFASNQANLPISFFSNVDTVVSRYLIVNLKRKGLFASNVALFL
mmetsp:Transcript_5814/g.8764  ORF Transcript_5814/g.8764 Transcript_5814/m.8764 type:complete len:263 (-) Transcript_5814:146-934(-)